MKTVTFKLQDADGLEHDYETELFSCDENAALQLIVAKPLMQLVARAVGALAPVLRVIDHTELQKVVAEKGIAGLIKMAKDAIPHVDWAMLPDALGAIPDMVQANGGPVLVARMFASTERLIPIPELQGLPTAGGDPVDPFMRQALNLPQQRDLAFADGNMREYWRAFVMVMAVNFTQIGRSGSASWKNAVEAMTFGLLKQSKEETQELKPAPKSGKPRP